MLGINQMRLVEVATSSLMICLLSSCVTSSELAENLSESKQARALILNIHTSKERHLCYSRALSGDSEALYDALFDPSHRSPDYNEEGEPPLVLSLSFLEALGDVQFSNFVMALPSNSRSQIGFALVGMGPRSRSANELFKRYPQTSRALNLREIERRLKDAPISL